MTTLPDGVAPVIGDHATVEGTLGAGTTIGYGAVVATNAVVGEEVTIGANAYIGDGAEIGDGVYIGAYAVVGDDAIVRTYAAVPANGCARAGSVVRAGETAEVEATDVQREADPDWIPSRPTAYVPVVFMLDAKVLAAIQAAKAKGFRGLSMANWHTCMTMHCRAGWAIALAGDDGRELEALVGPATAGGLIYRASTGRVPNFYATNDEALADIERCAAKQEFPVALP